MAELFLRFVPSQIEQIATALSQANPEQLKASAHKLKGSCMAIGATAMARACASLEPSPANAVEILQMLRTEFAYARGELLCELGARSAPPVPPRVAAGFAEVAAVGRSTDGE